MAAPSALRVKVESEFYFPRHALCLGVEPKVDFDRRSKGAADTQERDPDTGLRLWVATVMDNDPKAVEMGRSAQMKVVIAAEHQPVPPPSRVDGYPPLVAFEDLMISPWADRQLCKPPEHGATHKCRARLAFSLRASGMVDPADLVSGLA